jgi:hypothetical protein
MYYLVSVDDTGMVVHRTRSDWRVLRSAVVGTDDMLWNGNEEGGNVRSECEEDEGTDCDAVCNILT